MSAVTTNAAQPDVDLLSHGSGRSTDTKTQRANQAIAHMATLYNVYNKQNDIGVLIVTGSTWFLYRNVTFD